jgi:hypothetical protein
VEVLRGPAATTAGVASFFPACYSSSGRNGDDEEYAVVVFSRVDEGAEDLITLEGEDT